MIPAAYYYHIYLFVVTLMTLFAMSYYNKWGKQLNKKESSQIVAFLLLLFMVFYIGTRPVSFTFGDMGNYSHNYELLFGDRFWFDKDATNLIWDNFFVWMASSRIAFKTWVLIISIGYFCPMYIACRKLFGNDVLLAFVVYLGAFSTFSYGTNGMKAGLAASLFLVAIAYWKKLWISIPIAMLTYGFHHSMTLVIGSFFVALFFKNSKYYFIGWLFCLLIAALHITFFQILFATFTDRGGAEYLLSIERGGYHITGFRPDFILYSSVPIYMGYLLINKYKYQSDTYFFLLHLYIISNAMWMLCMYSDFSNRIAYLSWFIYPIVLLYPVISREKNQMQGKYFRWIVYGHLGFTLFMNFIYYA